MKTSLILTERFFGGIYCCVGPDIITITSFYTRYFDLRTISVPLWGFSRRIIIMSAEELKIRRELEIDVEKELAAELKDEIYNLSLRLHRLYQQQKQREGTKISQLDKKKQLADEKNNVISEVHINIRMDGGIKAETEESEKGIQESGCKPKITSKLVENMHKDTALRSKSNSSKTSKQLEKKMRIGVISDGRKNFDWVTTLRSGPSIVSSRQENVPKNNVQMWDDTVQCVGKNRMVKRGGKKYSHAF